MALTPSETKQLYAELRHLQKEIPGVEVRVNMTSDALTAAQSRVDEIEAILSAGVAKRTPPAELEP